MKRLLLLTVIFLIGGALLMQLIRHDSGYIIVHIAGYTLETSFWVSIVVVLLAIVILRCFYGVLRYSWQKSTGGFSWLARRRQHSATKHANSGLVYFIEGDWRAAKKELLKAAKGGEQPLVHYLAAARSAHELGLKEETRFLLAQAEKVAPENDLAIALSQAKIQLDDGLYEQSLAILLQIKSSYPKHRVVLDLLRKVYVKLNDWNAAVDLLPTLHAAKVMESSQQQSFDLMVYRSYILSLANDRALTEDHLVREWKKIPKASRYHVSIVECYASLLLRLGANDRAEIILRQTLKKNWQPLLVSLYGNVVGADNAAQLVVAENWLDHHSRDADLLLALGKISFRGELWGKAKTYLQKSLEIKEQPATFAMLAQLLAAMGQHKQSTALYQRGLLSNTASAMVK